MTSFISQESLQSQLSAASDEHQRAASDLNSNIESLHAKLSESENGRRAEAERAARHEQDIKALRSKLESAEKERERTEGELRAKVGEIKANELGA